MHRARRLVAFALSIAILACNIGPTTPAPTIGASPRAGASTPLRVLVTRTEGGPPVTGARVCAARTGAPEPSCATTGNDGAVTLFGSAGTYFVRVNGPAEQRWREVTRGADLTAGPVGLWVELDKMQRITGSVRDATGANVAGAEACAHHAKDGFTECEKSGADGKYAIDVKAGVYRVDVKGPPGERLVGQWARGRVFLEEADILDARTADVADVDVTLVRGVVLRGVVTFGGQPVEGASVCLRTLAEAIPLQCDDTNKDGRYEALREPGRYFIYTVPPSTIRAIPQWYDRALVGFNSSVFDLSADRTLDIALQGGTTITGTVRAEDGEPITNALVCFDTPFPTGKICRPSADGRYSITTRPEVYVVNVIPPAHSALIAEYWSRARTWPEADEYVVGRSDATLDLTLRRGTLFEGELLDKRGIPVAGAFVELWDDGGIAAATQTDAAGRFEMAVVPGRYRFEAFPPFIAQLVGTILTLDVPALDEVRIVLDDIAP